MYITSYSIRIVLLSRYVNIYGTMAPMSVFNTTKLNLDTFFHNLILMRLKKLRHKMICTVTFSSIMVRQSTILPGLFSSKLSKLNLLEVPKLCDWMHKWGLVIYSVSVLCDLHDFHQWFHEIIKPDKMMDTRVNKPPIVINNRSIQAYSESSPASSSKNVDSLTYSESHWGTAYVRISQLSDISDPHHWAQEALDNHQQRHWTFMVQFAIRQKVESTCTASPRLLPQHAKNQKVESTCTALPRLLPQHEKKSCLLPQHRRDCYHNTPSISYWQTMPFNTIRR
jgi:hypothetical protein